MIDETTATPDDIEQLRRTIRRSAAAVMIAAAITGGVLYNASRAHHWGNVQCLKASLSGSGYSRQDLVDHGCLD